MATAMGSVWKQWWQRASLRPSGVWPRKVPPARKGARVHPVARSGPSGATRYAPVLDLSCDGPSRVWLAVSRSAEDVCQLVVLKTLAEAAANDGRAMQQLMEEARLTARMNHPNVIRAHGLVCAASPPVLVLEYLPGPSLATLLAAAAGSSRFSLELRIAILVRLLRGLDHVHRLRDFDARPLRVVHGGVSPENVVVTYDGAVKLIDFSCARVRVSPTRNPLARRRLPYAPPEQFSGEPDARGDIFSAGVMLWELAANRPLWGRTPAPTIVRRLLAGDVPRLRDALPDVDPELDRICTRALSPQPDGRYRSARDMRRDLERFVARHDAFVPDSAIAALAAAVCREQRRDAARVIDARLAELGLSLIHAGAAASTPANGAASFEPGDGRPALGLGSGVATSTVIAAGIVFASLVVALVLSLTLAPEASPRSSSPARQLAGSTAALRVAPPRPAAPAPTDNPSVVRLVQLDVRVQPSHAVLSIDGQRLSSNPLVAAMVWDPHWHTIRAEAPGFEEFVAAFQLDSTVAIDTTLRRAPSGAVRRRGERSGELAGLRPRARSAR